MIDSSSNGVSFDFATKQVEFLGRSIDVKLLLSYFKKTIMMYQPFKVKIAIA